MLSAGAVFAQGIPVPRTWVGEYTCSESVNRTNPAYTQKFEILEHSGKLTGKTESEKTIEIHSLSPLAAGVVSFESSGVWKEQPERKWFIKAEGRIVGETFEAVGRMLGPDSKTVVREKCTVSLRRIQHDRHLAVINPSDRGVSNFKISYVGEPVLPSPETLEGGRQFSEWKLPEGYPWSFKGSPSANPRSLVERKPTPNEDALIQDAKKLVAELNVKAIAFMEGDSVVSVVSRPGITAKTIFPSASMSKQVTALGVGQAICENRLKLTTRADTLVTSLQGTHLGQATMEQLLLMSSASAETASQHTHGITVEETNKHFLGDGSVEELLATPRISSKKDGPAGFDYKSTDPYLAALMVQKAVGMKFTDWLHKTVFLPAGVADSYVLDTDKRGNFLATGGTKLTFGDWMRLAVYVQRERSKQGCFGDFLRSMGERQISIPKIPGVNGFFDGYSYFTWTNNAQSPSIFWSAGHFGQRIGWSQKIDNDRIFLTFGFGSDKDMGRIYPLASRWIN